jgi:hypothetical protein
MTWGHASIKIDALEGEYFASSPSNHMIPLLHPKYTPCKEKWEALGIQDHSN